MSKGITAIIVIIVLAGLGYGIYYYATAPKATNEEENATTTEETTMLDPFNATYSIEEQPIALITGESEVEITPDSASKKITMIFGDPVLGDLNNDQIEDAAVVLTQNSGGSGTFYYIAGAISEVSTNTTTDATTTKTIGTNGLLLGDRITIQNVGIEDGIIVVNSMDRELDEAMTEEPTISRTRYFKLEGDMLAEFIPEVTEEVVE